MKFNINTLRGILVTLSLLSLSRSYAQEVKAADAVPPLDSIVHKGVLQNGFSYYLRHNATEKGMAVLYLVNKVGSIVETNEQQGLAHFVEHMSFNGTKHFPGNKLVDYLEKAGVRFGADLNAYTSFDETVYQLPIQFDSPDLINNGIQIMRDWANEALLENTEINNVV
jgi:zinc protease